MVNPRPIAVNAEGEEGDLDIHIYVATGSRGQLPPEKWLHGRKSVFPQAVTAELHHLRRNQMSMNEDRSFFFSLVCLLCVCVWVEKRNLMRRWPPNRGSALPWSSFHRRLKHTWFGKSCTKRCTPHRLTQFLANESELCSLIWYINICCPTNIFGARSFCHFHCKNFHLKLRQTLHVISPKKSPMCADSIDMQITPISCACMSIPPMKQWYLSETKTFTRRLLTRKHIHHDRPRVCYSWLQRVYR